MAHAQLSRLIVTAAVFLACAGCSDSAEHLNQAADALRQHYAVHPLDREWAVRAIEAQQDDDKLTVHILVQSETDVARLRAMSRMEQFSAAKLACPVMSPALRQALDKTRVWVTLSANGKTITSSLCPQ